MADSSPANPESTIPAGEFRVNRTTRRDFSMLDYHWTHHRSQAARRTLQALLDPVASVYLMPSIPQGTLSASGLPELASLQTLDPSLRPASFHNGPSNGPGKPRLPQRFLEETLEDSVVEGLIQALYDALPDELNEPIAEMTNSGNVVGRHGYARRMRASSLWFPPVSSVGSAGPEHPPVSETPDIEIDEESAPPLEPRAFHVGSVPAELPLVTLGSLRDLEVPPPEVVISGGSVLRAERLLGHGEACYLRAQSALWSWRTLRQPNVEVLSEGPPHLNRNALVLQRLGPVTLLVGQRITRLLEEERVWGFELTTLTEQVLQGREYYGVQWRPDNSVVFHLESQQQLVMPNLTFLAPVYSAMRRKFRDGYVRNMLELTAE